MARNESTLTARKKGPTKHTPDILLIAVIIMIVAFGVVMVYSASHYHAMNNSGNPFDFAIKQGLIGFVGILGMLFITYKLDYRILSNMFVAKCAYFGSLAISLSVFVIGVEVNGARRWIQLPFGLTFQPSEIVKMGLIIMLSAYVVKYRKKLHHLLYVIWGGCIILLPTVIIAIENMSSAIVIAFIGFLILFVSTPKVWYYIVAVIGVGVLIGGVYSLAMNTDPTQELPGVFGHLLKQYRLDRVRVWKDPWLDPKGDGYQPIQSLYAVGSGGVFGKGLGQGIQKLGFLPEPYNDIIFAVICEELGLVGAVMLLLAYGVLVMRGLTIASQAYDLFGALVATGITGMVGIQVLINVAVNTGTLPTTGMQLPMVSYGGTALLILLCSLGFLTNISRTANIGKPEA
ncbi:MAG: FtsW/RodA/SpoVE family cell cycle protein [Cellulosilyticaceae bacterium]